MKTRILFRILACGVLFPAACWAQIPDSQNTMSCGDGFVQIGDTQAEVLSKCGEPTFREGNRWTYDRGPGQFLEILNFGEGRILGIVQGPRD